MKLLIRDYTALRSFYTPLFVIATGVIVFLILTLFKYLLQMRNADSDLTKLRKLKKRTLMARAGKAKKRLDIH